MKRKKRMENKLSKETTTVHTSQLGLTKIFFFSCNSIHQRTGGLELKYTPSRDICFFKKRKKKRGKKKQTNQTNRKYQNSCSFSLYAGFQTRNIRIPNCLFFSFLNNIFIFIFIFFDMFPIKKKK